MLVVLLVKPLDLFVGYENFVFEVFGGWCTVDFGCF